MTMIKGKCLCGNITYTLEREIPYLYHCHCCDCKSFSGSSFATNALVSSKYLHVNDPNSTLVRFESSPGVRRCFCGQCGSSIYSYLEKAKQYTSLHCGTLINPPDKKLDANAHVAEKCPWVKIDDTVKAFPKALDLSGDR